MPGCANSKPPVAVRIAVPPAERFVCAEEPRVPVEANDAAVAGFIADLASAGQSCRGRLAWLREWREKVR